MLLIFMLLATNFDMIYTALHGEVEPIYVKKLKKNRLRTIPPFIGPLNYVNYPTSGYYGHVQYQYDDEDASSKRPRHIEEMEFEPIINPIRHAHEAGINCDEFTNYALNCTRDSAIIRNSSSKSPPMPAKIAGWCKSIRFLTNCAIDWNSECKDVTESHFNEESIKGHMHVVSHICDDEWFLAHYDDLPTCIDKSSAAWEACYIQFKSVVDFEKNRTQEWTHFSTHFYLCCARTKFRRCTLDTLFVNTFTKCSHDEAAILQKFSVIISEGDVFQDCEKNMHFHSCPGGDPRPPTHLLFKLMNGETPDKVVRSETDCAQRERLSLVLTIVVCLIKLCL